MSNLPTTSINRPVLATVLNLVIIIFGFIGMTYLGVREYPSVDQPIISVSTSYPGANADVIENQITEPLEQAINGIPGVRSLSSNSSQGSSRITVEFELDVDMEAAANDVRDKVSQAQRRLPRDVDPPTVSKNDADATPILAVGIQSKTRSLLDLSDIAELTFKERLQTISGVSAINIWGQQRYSMRLWLDPAKMGGYGVTPADVQSAVTRENVELPSGEVEGDAIKLSIRTLGLMKTPSEFNNIIIKSTGTQIVRFSDIGYAELYPEDEYSIQKVNGVPAVANAIVPQPGANHIQIADEVYKRLEEIKKDLPEDIETSILFDSTQFIRASIAEVEETIYVAFILVILVIFLFLRDWRITLIPVVAIPISLIGGFFVMYLAGFSINVLTLLAIVLAVGLVVDDAIVMVENIYVKIEAGMEPREAGIQGSKEIYFAIISTTITLVSVFLPIVFMQGMTGKLFREFSMVIAGAVIISAFVALTFTPMMATKMLKQKKQHNWFYRITEPFFVWLTDIYRRSLIWFLKYKWISFILMAVTLIGMYYFYTQIPSEMAPLEDRSQISVSVTAQQGATFDYIKEFIEDIALELADSIPEAEGIQSMMWGGSGFMRLMLVKPNERIRIQQQIADQISDIVRGRTRARMFVTQQSSLAGRRGGMPIQYVLQSLTLDKLKEVLPIFLQKVSESPVFQQSDANLKFTKPEMQVHINRDKAIQLGVSTQNIGQTFQLALSGQRMGYFYMNGKQYQIIGMLNRQDRNKPADIRSLYVRNNAGQMIQLSNFVETTETTAPPTLYRYNRFIAATVSSGLAKGYTIGQGLDEMDKIAKEVLDDTFRTALSGESKEFRDSSSSMMFAFGLALILIFLVLAAQFESFKDPLIIMFTVPLALLGALGFMWYFDQTMNIFSQIGIIMLIGLVSKNGILIVEFANQRKEAGLEKFDAIRDASVQRLRPILMTALSTILGLLPLAMASGEGANSRIAMGITVVGGMLIATFMTLYVVPAMYAYISTKTENMVKRD
ncbi:MAG: efflux RND transporter permease subunit [Prevotellaceae bacterium]|jgi:multidrug efflux pump|nr:efflux RND transporter permease subunit [Prevotellaceae bacterium]